MLVSSLLVGPDLPQALALAASGTEASDLAAGFMAVFNPTANPLWV